MQGTLFTILLAQCSKPNILHTISYTIFCTLFFAQDSMQNVPYNAPC